MDSLFHIFKRFGVVLALVFLSVALAACGSAEESASSEDEKQAASSRGPEEELSGSVVIDGSGTVYPFMALMAEKYMTENPNVSVEVGRSGTSAGFQKLLVIDGTDFNDASRKIKEEEVKQAEALGLEVKELKVALDGLTIVVNPENDWATELTKEEVIRIFLAESGIEKWSDVRPGFPDEPINRYGPNENHGTYEFFWEVILEEKDLAEDINLQQEYATLVDLISKDKYAIGFFGYGYYANNADKVKAVSIDFGQGPVEPSVETISEDGPYSPFTRPVFTYLNLNHAKEKPQVLDYALYTMKNAAKVAKETGFAPLAEEEIKQLVADLEAIK